jgi:hypothetical protein
MADFLQGLLEATCAALPPELGHFEARHQGSLIKLFADELPFLKEALGEGIEAEPWDKGWTRVYLTQPLGLLGPAEQARLASRFATLTEMLEPIRREAIHALAGGE